MNFRDRVLKSRLGPQFAALTVIAAACSGGNDSVVDQANSNPQISVDEGEYQDTANECSNEVEILFDALEELRVFWDEVNEMTDEERSTPGDDGRDPVVVLAGIQSSVGSRTIEAGECHGLDLSGSGGFNYDLNDSVLSTEAFFENNSAGFLSLIHI